MMLFGAKLEYTDYGSFTEWSGKTPSGAHVYVSDAKTFMNHNTRHAVKIWWADGSEVLGLGPTFEDAKRDCVRMLSERSREVGRV